MEQNIESAHVLMHPTTGFGRCSRLLAMFYLVSDWVLVGSGWSHGGGWRGLSEGLARG